MISPGHFLTSPTFSVVAIHSLWAGRSGKHLDLSTSQDKTLRRREHAAFSVDQGSVCFASYYKRPSHITEHLLAALGHGQLRRAGPAGSLFACRLRVCEWNARRGKPRLTCRGDSISAVAVVQPFQLKVASRWQCVSRCWVHHQPG